MEKSARFGSRAHRDFIKDHQRRQKIYTPEQCLQELIDFMKSVVKGEPIAEKIAMEAITRCDTREGMLTNRRFFQDYLEETTGIPHGFRSEPAIVYGDRIRYLPSIDTIELSTSLSAPPEYIQRAHELGHRDGVLKGAIPKKLLTRGDEIAAEKYAWKHAIALLREQGLWDELAERWARKGFADHGIGAMNFMEMDKIIREAS